MLRTSELDAVLLVGSQECRVEGENHCWRLQGLQAHITIFLSNISARLLSAYSCLGLPQPWCTTLHLGFLNLVLDPLFKFAQVPLDGIPFFLLCQLHHSASCYLQTCWGCTCRVPWFSPYLLSLGMYWDRCIRYLHYSTRKSQWNRTEL